MVVRTLLQYMLGMAGEDGLRYLSELFKLRPAMSYPNPYRSKSNQGWQETMRGHSHSRYKPHIGAKQRSKV